MRYELFYLVGASKDAELEKIKSDVSAIITAQGGVLEEKETLEKRRLSYEIKHETQGIYIAQRFEMEKENIKEVIAKLNLYTGVLRFTVSRADELPELKTKEERIAEAQAAPREREIGEAKKEKKEKESEQKESEPKADGEKKPESQEDMDKKLEEILNI
jgi:small subunit ribosomal protein S6